MRKIVAIALGSLLFGHFHNHATRHSSPTHFLRLMGMLALAASLLCGPSAQAQAPGLVWSNNVGARIFTVDAQTNVYAYTSNRVIVINGAGSIVQTNTFCPLPAIAQRDSAGNFYFAGSFDGTNDFGGITLVGGCTNCSDGHYAPGWPICFLAKYDHTGALQWVTGFSVVPGAAHRVDDLVVNPDGTTVVGFDGSEKAALAMFSASGSNLWVSVPIWSVFADCAALTVTGSTGSNGFFLHHRNFSIVGGTYDSSGHLAAFTSKQISWQSASSEYARPVTGSSNNVYLAGLTNSSTPFLEQDLSDTTVVWDKSLGTIEQWVVAGDTGGNVYLAGTSGLLAKYDGAGSQLWTTNYGPVVAAMLVDAQGNSFVSFADGSIARLNTPSPAPMLSVQNLGSTFVLSWPSNYSNCAVEWVPTAAGSWTNFPCSPALVGANLVVTNSYNGQTGFYRLRMQ